MSYSRALLLPWEVKSQARRQERRSGGPTRILDSEFWILNSLFLLQQPVQHRHIGRPNPGHIIEAVVKRRTTHCNRLRCRESRGRSRGWHFIQRIEPQRREAQIIAVSALESRPGSHPQRLGQAGATDFVSTTGRRFPRRAIDVYLRAPLTRSPSIETSGKALPGRRGRKHGLLPER